VLASWRQFDRRLALVEPDHATRSSGDPESQSSVRRLFTDRVILEAPILTMGPQGGPVIDLGAMIVQHAARLFGIELQLTPAPLVQLRTAKSFPLNTEVAFETPARDSRLRTLHCSLSSLPDEAGYRPRPADQRVGYFTTRFDDLGKFTDDGIRSRYINRWRLEKRDPGLNLSPPKRPLVFYLEHTTPVRYRAWIKRGILAWNAAFERVGLHDAIEVQQQDALTGEHMEKDPEDVRYNFVRWLSNDIPTAIGPHRAHPVTGEILDADILLSDGWIRTYIHSRSSLLPALLRETLPREAGPWLAAHPEWDPVAALGGPGPREEGGGGMADSSCQAAQGRALDLSALALVLTTAGGHAPELIDGMPEEYVGPLLPELTAHEVGHTLGLRHNFRASTAFSLDEINDPARRGQPMATSVMDYLPINLSVAGGTPQGPVAMETVGPYDLWAIEYGYSFAEDLGPILARASEPQHRYGTDEDAAGPDPRSHRNDLGSSPLGFARRQMELVRRQRELLVDKLVQPGQSWARALRGYEATIALQTRALGTMVRWIGGTFVERARKGDGGGDPLGVVPPGAQREALSFVLETAFRDEAFGLTPDLVRHLTSEVWLDEWLEGSSQPAAWPVHDRIRGLQRAMLAILMSPVTLARVLDNEARTPPGSDAVTVPDVLGAIRLEVWSEIAPPASGAPGASPSSLRRHLQREHLERLLQLARLGTEGPAAVLPAASLALVELQELRSLIERALERRELTDAYTAAHLAECRFRIQQTLEPQPARFAGPRREGTL
jgi:hypothetical protein